MSSSHRADPDRRSRPGHRNLPVGQDTGTTIGERDPLTRAALDASLPLCWDAHPGMPAYRCTRAAGHGETPGVRHVATGIGDVVLATWPVA